MPSLRAKFIISDKLEKILDNTTRSKIETAVIDGTKEATAAGLSPVKGHGRFQRYSENYPSKRRIAAGKKKSPVNLRLRGDMIDAIKPKDGTKNTVRIGISDGINSKKAETHNEGTQSHIPVRKFLPTGQRDEFIQSIVRPVLDIIQKRIDDILRKT